MYMDTESNGPSSSYRGRGNRGWGSDRGRGNAGGRNYSSGRSYYDQENYGPQVPRGGGQYGRGNNNTNNGYNDSWNSNARGGYRGRSSNYWGNSNRGGRYQSQGRGRGRGFDDPEDIQFYKILRGHTASVTAILVDPGSGQLFTASKDKTVKVWDFHATQCVRTVEVPGEVDSMLMESGMLFVGLHQSVPGKQTAEYLTTVPGSILVYNLQAGSEHALPGHMGPVYSLAAANNMLFSGGHDSSIRVYQFNQPAGLFQEAAVLTAAQGGHTSAVKCLQVINNFLFSADFAGGIKVWDMTAGQCVQSIDQAHNSTIMSLLAWEGYLLSGSTDGSIMIWQPCENPAPGAVIDPHPAYRHPPNVSCFAEEILAHFYDDIIGSAPNIQGDPFGKVLALSGTTDIQGKSVLLSSYSDDNVVRLWQLPDFTDRGHLNAIKSSIAVQCCQQYLFAGDYATGCVKVWKWKGS